jgi:hypothetical protein
MGRCGGGGSAHGHDPYVSLGVAAHRRVKRRRRLTCTEASPYVISVGEASPYFRAPERAGIRRWGRVDAGGEPGGSG